MAQLKKFGKNEVFLTNNLLGIKRIEEIISKYIKQRKKLKISLHIIQNLYSYTLII